MRASEDNRFRTQFNPIENKMYSLIYYLFHLVRCVCIHLRHCLIINLFPLINNNSKKIQG